MSNPTKRPTLALLLPAIVLSLAACAGATAAPTASPSNAAAATPRPTPTAVPGASSGGNPGGGVVDPGTGTGGSGGGTGGNPGGGTIPGGIVFPDPGDPNQNPLFGQANYVTPMANLINPHPVNVQLVRALQLEDRTIVADLRWYSGVAPCNQLDHVEIVRDDAAKTIKLTVIEGSGPGDMACIDIAQLNATTIDLGKLAAGKWKLSADGDAAEINLDVK